MLQVAGASKIVQSTGPVKMESPLDKALLFNFRLSTVCQNIVALDLELTPLVL